MQVNKYRHFIKKIISYSIFVFIKAQATETFAMPQSKQDPFAYKLYGYKWFSSATDSDMTITLARVLDENKNVKFKFYYKIYELLLVRQKQ